MAIQPLAAGILLVMLVGCAGSKPRHSGRLGFLDRIMKEGSSRERGRHRAISKSSTDSDAESKEDVVAQKRAFQDSYVAKNVKQGALAWPLRSVKVTSSFGERGDEFHEGVDLKAPKGTPVHATHSGVVAYSGNKIRGYGKMVVLKSPRGFATVYAHHSRNLVKNGQKIRIGQKIALSGATGRATGPHLHFEVRDGVVAVDPMKYLSASNHSKPKSAGQKSSSRRTLASTGR